MATDLEKLMLTHYTDNEIHVTPEQKFILDHDIGSLMDGFTLIQSDFAYVDTILANIISSGSIFADFINTDLLEADKILASTIEATYLYTMHMDAEVANITSLFANYATIENLTATRAEIDVLLADYIKADSIIVNDLSASTILADAATISSLLSFNISAEGIASLRITSDQIVIADGFINDAMIMDLSANKIKSGSIYTNLVNIVSESGNLGIMDNTIQIKDDMDTTRVQIGKDADEDYSMYVWDAAGNLMFDATGLHEGGIKHPIIRDDMVSDLANISGHKLNIESVITEINDGSTTLKSSKIHFDEDGQTLDVKLGSITSLVDAAASEVSTLRTDVQVAQGSINTIISEVDMATIEGLGTSFYEQYNTTKSTVDSWEVSLGNQETTFPGLINSVKTNNAKISATPEAISAVLTSEYMDTLGTIQAMKSSITLNQGAIEAKVSKNGVIAAINLDPGSAKIYASKINLVGAVTVLSDITGALGTITSGTIIGDNILGSNYNVGLSGTGTSSSSVRIWAGSTNRNSAPFRITQGGSMVATNADITGKITATSGSFTGSITSPNATITGGSININTGGTQTSRISLNYGATSSKLSPWSMDLENATNKVEIGLGGVWLTHKSTGQQSYLYYNTMASPPHYGLTVGNLDVQNFASIKSLNVNGILNVRNNIYVAGDHLVVTNPLHKWRLAAGAAYSFRQATDNSVYLVTTTHAGVIYDLRSTHIVYCTSLSNYAGTVHTVHGGNGIEVSYTSPEIYIRNTRSAGAATLSILKLS